MSVFEVSAEIGGRKLTLQTGKLAKQADASVLATYGDTMVLVTVVSSRKLGASQDFFPLTVDFQEKYYSAGRLPGGFFKREARPSDRATLSARLIDRPMRPLFPEDYLYETNVVATVLSFDGVNEPDILASIAASAAVHISDIPWNGPFGTVRVGCMNGQLVCNFSPADQTETSTDLLVSGLRTGVVMVEGSAKEISEKEMMDAIDFANDQIQTILDLQEELKKKINPTKRSYDKPLRDEALKAKIKDATWDKFAKAFSVKEKLARYAALDEVKKGVKLAFAVKEPKSAEEVAKNKLADFYYEEIKATYARELTLNTKARIDGRPYNEIRPITCETGLLPRVHGSALFTRGETQVLSTVTLGTAEDEQKIDSISGVYQKTFMLHYNFPPYSVGEARPLRPPGRREVGHGFLAERALSYVIPTKDKFPYTIRIVSEVLESNGSSSMASVCSGSLALMAAGVPIEKAVAGVAMGLIKEGDKIAVLSDILGDEDHLGDMDFKVCGTQGGVTAFQMDLKIGGVSREIMEKALDQAREGRLHVLSKMNEVLSKAAESVSAFAPRIFTLKVKPSKVREVIGSGGKVIRGIIEKTGVKIDIEDDGTIHIASIDGTSAENAIAMINQIVEEAEPGKIYEGKVSRIADFGAFIEIIPGTDGLCHISELEHFRVRRVEDVIKMGETVRVKCLEVDPMGKIRLSRKALLPKDSGPQTPPSEGQQGGGTDDSSDQPAPIHKKEDETENFGNRADFSGGGQAPERSPDRGGYDRPDRSGSGDRDRGGRSGGQRGGYESRGGGDRGGRGGGGQRGGGDRGGRGGGYDNRPSGGGDRGGRGGGGYDNRPSGGGDRGGRGGGGYDNRPSGGGDRGGRGGGYDNRPSGGGDRGGRGGGYDNRPSGGGDRDRGGREPMQVNKPIEKKHDDKDLDGFYRDREDQGPVRMDFDVDNRSSRFGRDDDEDR